MDKSQILGFYIKDQKGKVDDMKVSLERLNQGIDQSSGPNKSHSDTTRFQESGIALELDERVSQLQKKILLLERLSAVLGQKEQVFVGSLFTLRELPRGETFTYFVVEKGEGDFIEFDDQEIIFVSFTAPIVQTVVGKKKGDLVIFRGKEFEITEVQ